MRHFFIRSVLAVLGLILGLCLILPAAREARATAAHDGNWSVLIVTEQGGCDRGYRYNVSIYNGHVSYQGDASVDLSGTVAPSGIVKVNIKFGDSGANGSGQLSAHSGTGTWHGVGSTGSCAGHWEAERR
jgi:hypothetical protein